MKAKIPWKQSIFKNFENFINLSIFRASYLEPCHIEKKSYLKKSRTIISSNTIIDLINWKH